MIRVKTEAFFNYTVERERGFERTTAELAAVLPQGG